MRAAAKALVRAANKGGGEDNITVVFFEIQADEDTTQRTVTLPALEPDEDDADTLDELDAVPAVQVSEERRERREHPVRRRVVFGTLLLLLVLVAGGLGVWGLWRSHFVGAESNGHVAVYQGLPWNIAGNLHLYRTVYESQLLVAQRAAPSVRSLHSLRSKSSTLGEVRHTRAARAMSLRNRELANLVVVGLLTAISFASVYIARQAVVFDRPLAYAGFFFALYLARMVAD